MPRARERRVLLRVRDLVDTVSFQSDSKQGYQGEREHRSTPVMGDQRIGCHGTLGYRTIPLQTGNGRSRMPKPVVGRVKISTRVDAAAQVPEAGGVDGSSAPRSDIAGAQGAPRKACGAPYLPAKLATPRTTRRPSQEHYWLRTIRRILSRRAPTSRSWPCSVGA